MNQRLLFALWLISSRLSVAAVYGILTPAVDAYYADSVNGSDSNNCTTPATACLTLAHLAALDASANKATWRLVTGSRFRETLNVPRSGMTLSIHGTTAKPIVDGSAVISAGSWTLVAGKTNCYQSTGLVIEQAGNAQVAVKEDTARLTRVASTAACDTTEGSFSASSDSVSPITIYVHPTGNGNPASNGKVYEYTARNYVINSNFTNTTVIGVAAEMAIAGDGPIRLANTGSTVWNTYAQNCWQHCYYIQGGSYVTNAEANDGGFGSFVLHMDNGAGYSIVCENCYSHIATLDTTNNTQGFYAHTGGTAGQNFQRISLINPLVINQYGCAGAANTDLLYIYNPTCTTGFDGIVASAVSTVVQGGTISAGTRAIDIGGVGNISVSVNGTAFTGGTLLNNQNNVTVDIENSSFSGGGGAFITASGTGDSYTLLNNVYALPSNSAPTYSWFVPLTLRSDSNNFTSTGATFVINGTNYNSPASYKAATGQDAHSTP